MVGVDVCIAGRPQPTVDARDPKIRGVSPTSELSGHERTKGHTRKIDLDDTSFGVTPLKELTEGYEPY